MGSLELGFDTVAPKFPIVGILGKLAPAFRFDDRSVDVKGGDFDNRSMLARVVDVAAVQKCVMTAVEPAE